mmetsp:Transcript_100946/g.225481  ORF Transcript_100946/g.225481 Transcript_100946/m.225481 type:complete len:133 (-) Transcript_100946:123-521(-)
MVARCCGGCCVIRCMLLWGDSLSSCASSTAVVTRCSGGTRGRRALRANSLPFRRCWVLLAWSWHYRRRVVPLSPVPDHMGRVPLTEVADRAAVEATAAGSRSAKTHRGVVTDFEGVGSLVVLLSQSCGVVIV